MKKFFRIVSMLALAGGTLVYTGCTDYSADIDGLKDRVDKLEKSSGTLESVQTQISNLSKLTDELKTADEKVNVAIEALKTGKADATTVADLTSKASTIESAIAVINSAIADLKSGKADAATVTNLIEKINGIEKDVDQNDKDINSVSERVTKIEAIIGAISDYATKEWATATFATKEAVVAVEKELAGLKTQLEAAQTKYDGKIADLDAAVKAAKAAADAAQATADKALTTESFNKILGVYAEEGALEAKIAELMKADSDNAKSIEANYKEYTEFVAAFDDEVNDLIGEALGNGGKFDYAALEDDIEEIDGKIDEINTEIEKIKLQITDISGRLKTAEEQVESLKALVDSLSEVTEESELTIIALTIQKADVEVTDSLATEVDEIKSMIGDIKSEISQSKSEAERTYATLESLKKVSDELGSLKATVEQANSQYDIDIANLKKAVEKAQSTADKALTTESLAEIFGVYATKGELEKKINAIESAGSENASKINENYAEYTEFVGAFDDKVKDLIDAALGNEGEYDFNSLKTALSNLTTTVNELKTYVSAEIEKIWGAINTEIRSLETLSEDYYKGRAVVDYTYTQYSTLKFSDASSDKTVSGYKFAADAGWNYTTNESKASNWPDVNVSYRVNPSSAAVTETTPLSVLIKKVNERTTLSVEEKGYVGTATYESYENGILKVGLVLDEKEGGVAYNAASRGTSMLLFNLQAGRADNSTVTSDAGVLNVKNTSITPKIAFVEGVNEKTALATVIEENTLSQNGLTVDYAGTLDVKSKIRTDISGVDYDFEKNYYGFSYKFELISYVKDAEGAVAEDEYAKIDSETGVLTPKSAGEDGKDGSISSFGHMPLVKVTLNDEAGNILAVGFVKVTVVNDAYHTTDAQTVTIPTDAATNGTYSNSTEIGDIYSAVEEESLESFLEKYVLYKGDADKVLLYTHTPADGDATPESYTVDSNSNITIVQENNEDVETFKVTITAAEAAKIYVGEGHKKTVYVRYVLKADETNMDVAAKDILYVPVEITVEKNLSGTIGTKTVSFWKGDNNDMAYLNVESWRGAAGDLSTSWTTDLNKFWKAGHPEFTVNGVATEDVKYKFYFAPEQPEIEVDGVKYQLTTAYHYVKGSSMIGSPQINVLTNAEVFNVERDSYVLAGHGIYINDKLYAGSIDANNLVATINQTTGEITFATTDIAKKLLNAKASIPVETELYANVGIAMYRSEYNSIVVSGASTIDRYYFTRPINASTDVKAVEFIDAGKASVSLFDVVDVTDWSEQTGSFKTAENAVLFKYYGFTGVRISGEVKSNITGEIAPLDVKATGINLKHMVDETEATSGATIVWLDGESSGATTYIDVTTSSNVLGELKAGFGELVYTNGGKFVTKSYKLYVPVEMTYVWGTFTFEVEITVNPTK